MSDPRIDRLIQHFEQEKTRGILISPEVLCRDCPELLVEVKKQLEALEAMDRIMGQTAPFIPTRSPAETMPGDVIGPYKLRQLVGEGGMGSVWIADQSQPVRRQVAVKLIKAGMDSSPVIARFNAEKQALALMDHPNIAKVIDAGSTECSRPYFVMELVKGTPITQYCDRARLTPRERLELFIPVCQAIQHAHQKGIIHRDLKPSNILVGLYDGKPVAKVIDFGVAKATGPKLTEETLYTEVGAIIGTLEYMSPEQAEMDNVDIDTRADVYSLGVILYELLAGSPPFSRKQIDGAAMVEMLRLIREVDPPKPSTKLSTSAELLELAAARRLEPKRLTTLVRGELDWIVMKCLEKERARRYETANGLARDIGHYLKHEPVLAGPPSQGYRIKKFIRRNKGIVLAASLVLLALLAGIAGTGWGLMEAHQSLARESRAKEDALKEKKNAEDRERATQSVLTFVEKNIFAAARPEGLEGGLGRDVTVRRALEVALPQIVTSFSDQPLIEARLRMTLGQTLVYLGEPAAAAEQFNLASQSYSAHLGADDPMTLKCMNNLAGSYLEIGEKSKAAKLHEQTLALQKAKLGPDHADTLVTTINLANDYHALGQNSQAIALMDDAMSRIRTTFGADHPTTMGSMNNLASYYRSIGEQAKSMSLYQETLELQKAKLGPNHRDTLRTMGNLATCYLDRGEHDRAIKLLQQTLELRMSKLGPAHPDTLSNLDLLADEYHIVRNYEQAVKLDEESLVLRKEQLPQDHVGRLKRMNNLANAYHALGKEDQAVKLHEETLAQRKIELGLDHPDTIVSMYNLAISYRALGRYSEAGQLYEQVLAAWKVKPPANPTFVTGVMYGLGCMHAHMSAQASDGTAEGDLAMQWLHQAVDAGYSHLDYMKKDTELDALHKRDDFKKLIAELEAKLATQKASNK